MRVSAKELLPGQRVVGLGKVAGVENNATRKHANGTTTTGYVRVRFTDNAYATFSPEAEFTVYSR